jgi:hypothetical protein
MLNFQQKVLFFQVGTDLAQSQIGMPSIETVIAMNNMKSCVINQAMSLWRQCDER